MSDLIAYGNTVSFEVHAANIVGNNFNNVKILAIVDADAARAFGADALALHNSVKSQLPDEIPDDYRAYPYILLEMPNKETKVIGNSWIISDTVELQGAKTGYLQIAGITSNDLDIIVRAIAGNGYTVSSVELV